MDLPVCFSFSFLCRGWLSCSWESLEGRGTAGVFLADLGAVQLSLRVLWRGALWRAVLFIISGVIFDLVA